MTLTMWQQRLLVVAVGLLAFLVVTATLTSSFQWMNRPFPGFFLYQNLAVGPDFLPQWSGGKEGLRFLDRVVALEGRPVNRRQEIYELVRGFPLNFPFHYTIERAGRQISIAIPSMKFTFLDWLLTYGIYLLVGLGFLAIGITPFYLGSGSPSAAPLFFMVSLVFFWFATTFDFLTTNILPKEVRAFSFTLTPSAGIHLGLLLARGRTGSKGKGLYLFLIYGVSILLGLFYSSSFYASVSVWQWALWLSYVYSCLAALIFLGLLWMALRSPISDLERSRLRVVLAGAVLGFFLPTLGTVIRSSFFWEIPHNILLIPTVFFPLSVAFALLKYNLFDIDAIFKIGLQVALTGALLLIYVLLVALLSISVGIYERDLFIPLFFSILVVLVFSPLLRWIEAVVGRYVYRKEYDPVKLQSEVSLLLRSLSRPQAVSEKYLKTIADQVGIERAFLFCRVQEKGNSFAVSYNGNGRGAEGLLADFGSPWIVHLEVRKKGISNDEVETDPVYHDNRDKLLEIFSDLKLELLIPMIFEEKLLGLVSFGKKRSGRGYSADDFWLLSNLANQLALAIKNGMLFEESEKAKENYQYLYDQSQATNKRLLDMDQQRKHFVANISHELRTPVSTILGYAEVLLDPGFAGDTRKYLERIVTSGQNLSQLMDSLLDFSRMEGGTMSITLQEVNIRELFQLLGKMARRLLKERPIKFRSQIDSALDTIRTDGKKLQQILTHLLTNALKFTRRGEISLDIRSMSEGGHEFVEFSVSDTGIGINQRDQGIIFEEFRQLDGSSTRQYGGTGLGLSLCRKLAQSLGGRIEVQSEPAHGSTFSLILPLRGTLAAPVARLEAF
ncbi:MAG: ATP-binding protein [Candidatus Binatia bacterium]